MMRIRSSSKHARNVDDPLELKIRIHRKEKQRHSENLLKIVQLEQIAAQLPDAFTDVKRNDKVPYFPLLMPLRGL